jgi:hypothetical protein
MQGVRVTVRASVRAPQELVFETLVPIDLTSIMRGYAFLPAVVAVDGSDGSWNARGQTRTLRLADGNSLREELTEYRKPDGVRYVIDGVTGPLGALVHGAEGSFDFFAHDDMTTVEWTYVYLPRSPLSAPFVALVIGVLWRRYMVRALATALADVEARSRSTGRTSPPLEPTAP